MESQIILMLMSYTVEFQKLIQRLVQRQPQNQIIEESGILTKHDFKGGKARYEASIESHHDHLIDIKTGQIIEFVDEDIEKLQHKVAEKYGYKLVDHKLELYGVKKKNKCLKKFLLKHLVVR